MRVSAAEARATVEGTLQKHGATAAEAALLADVLIEAELRGRTTHGFNRLESMLKNLRRRGPEKPEIVEERGPLVRINGNNANGYLVAACAADATARVARAEGHALTGVRNTRHAGMMGYYAARIAQQGIIALIFADCAPLMAPWGATESVLGTNPIAAAFPSEPYPILVDTSTSAITWGAVDRARSRGEALPPDVALDAEGRPTRDAAAAQTMLPAGGHKGYALALMVQLFAVAAGAAAVPDDYGDYGLLMLGMRTDLFAPQEQYERRVQELIRRIKSARPAQPGIEALVPGERSYRERERRLRDGIDVPDELWARLRG